MNLSTHSGMIPPVAVPTLYVVVTSSENFETCVSSPMPHEDALAEKALRDNVGAGRTWSDVMDLRTARELKLVSE